MEAKLTFNRTIVRHPAAKGGATELEWTSMLSTYLPRRYCAAKAFVIDADGRISDEIDIVIFDRQYSPFILEQNGVTFIPAECVYAVIEVKQELNGRNIAYAQRKAASVRRLKRTSIPIPHAGGIYEAKVPAKILAGIVTLSGKLSQKDRERLQNATDSKVLNFGCSLVGKTAFRLPNFHPWEKNEAPHELDIVSDPNTLVNVFLGLLSELQKVGTVPAIDLGAYQRTGSA